MATLQTRSSVLQTANKVGSGTTYTLLSPPTGYVAFSSISGITAGDEVVLHIRDQNGNWEEGSYTYTNSTTITIATIIDSSNGGAAVSWPSGSVQRIKIAPLAKLTPVMYSSSTTPRQPKFDRMLALDSISSGKGTWEDWDFTNYSVYQLGGMVNLMAEKAESAGNGIRLMVNAYFDGTDYRKIINDESMYWRIIDGSMTFFTAGTGTADSIISWTQVARCFNGGGWTFGPSTLLNQGAGTVNASAFYDDGVGPLCFPIELARTGEIGQRWDGMDLAEKLRQDMKGGDFNPLTPDHYAKFWRDNGHLYSMPPPDTQERMSIGDFVASLMATVDYHAIHIEKLNNDIKELSRKLEILISASASPGGTDPN